MIKPILKTASLAFVVLAAFAVSSSAEPLSLLGEKAHVTCSAKAEIDRGWEDQQRLVEQRLAEKEAEGLAVPGAIIVPPFESYAPYRTDVPAVATARKGAKAGQRTADEQPASRH